MNKFVIFAISIWLFKSCSSYRLGPCECSEHESRISHRAQDKFTLTSSQNSRLVLVVNSTTNDLEAHEYNSDYLSSTNLDSIPWFTKCHIEDSKTFQICQAGHRRKVLHFDKR